MTDTAVRLDRPRHGQPLADRAQAFRTAARHTRLVRFLRRAIVFGSIALVVGVAGGSWLFSGGKLPGGVTINQATLNGTRVMMDSPKLNGFRRDGRPYEVRARSGIQDIRTPKIIELTEIEATIQTADGASVRIIAPAGVFDSGADKMRLTTGANAHRIRISSTEGYDALMRSADMDFKRGEVTSREPVEVTLKNGAVNADSLEIQGHGAQVTFTGNVRSVIAPDNSVRATRAGAEGRKE